MDAKLADIIADLLETDGYEASVRDDYSGRGMYGATTHGIDTDASPATILGVVISNAEYFVDRDLTPLFPDTGLRWDNMGLGYILY